MIFHYYIIVITYIKHIQNIFSFLLSDSISELILIIIYILSGHGH